MADILQAVRGMNDILPAEIQSWQYIEQFLRRVVAQYGYQEIRTPIVEDTALFQRSVGNETDIVSKEMYTFTDKNGDSLTLRPEGTAAVVRALVQHNLLQQHNVKVYYNGPMFRHERPQKGRYRQFHHFGVEAFGVRDVAIDVEMLLLCHRIFKLLQVDNVKLEINTIGSKVCREQYRSALINYFQQHVSALDADDVRRLEHNPLRLLDSKNPKVQQLLTAAPRIYDYLTAEDAQYWQTLCKTLDTLNIVYTINPFIVRGLDYYNDTVFEWVTTDLGAQSAVCAGGRYDSLVAQLHGGAVPAIGFSIGLERLLLLLQQQNKIKVARSVSAYVITDVRAAAENIIIWQWLEELRNALPNLQIIYEHNESSFKAMLRRANALAVDFALLLGERELQQQMLTIKFMQQEREQQTVMLPELITILQDYTHE